MRFTFFSLLSFFWQDVQDRYFTTSYMWSLIPLFFFGVIFAVYVLRILVAMASASMELSKVKDEHGESPYLLHMAIKRRDIKAQHVSAALLLSYLVLPPVAVRKVVSLPIEV
jgi:hypothetical protein